MSAILHPTEYSGELQSSNSPSYRPSVVRLTCRGGGSRGRHAAAGPRWPQQAASWTSRLHVLELVDAAFGVALADFAQGLVLVAALAHVFAVDLVHGRLFRLVAGLRQVLLQSLETESWD